MIKALMGKPDGTRVAIFGIDAENVKRMKNGRGLLIDMGEMGLPGWEVIILYGETLDDIQKELEPLIDLETKITIDPTLYQEE